MDNKEAGLRALKSLMYPNEVERPELVLGLVAPLGTELGHVQEALKSALSSIGYQSEPIRVSKLLETSKYKPFEGLPNDDDPDYYEGRMSAGDGLRRSYGTGAALAARTIALIQEKREKETGTRRGIRSGFATIVNSLKHPDEVALLRGVYGSRFFLVGVVEPREDRRRSLIARLSEQGVKFAGGTVASKAEELIARDEQDPRDQFGQNVRSTYALADVLIATSRGSRGGHDVERFVDLLFGRPFLTPTRDEQAMFQAAAASLRSSAAGRQVGAVITTPSGEVIATGVNEVPKPGGGQYWSGDVPDFRDHMFEKDPNEELKRRTVSEILQRMQEAGWLVAPYDSMPTAALRDEALVADSRREGGSLLGSTRVMGLLEFGRIVHAEMGAITDAARRGVPTGGCTLYTTTYPCHECARHILSSGIIRVVYVAPYPRSLVASLYSDLIDVEGGAPTSGRVQFEPFVGVAPSLFLTFFTAPKRREADGRLVAWNPKKAAPRLRAEIDSPRAEEADKLVLTREWAAITAERRIIDALTKESR